MAKHQQGKKMSKGLNTSSKRNVKSSNLNRLRRVVNYENHMQGHGEVLAVATIRKVADQFDNAMRSAFKDAKVSNAIIGSKLVAHVVSAVSSKAGIKRVGRGWTANVSARTLKKLTQEGVFA